MNSKVKASTAPPIELSAEEKLRLYSAEEVVELKMVRCSARWLKEQAYKRAIPSTRSAGKLFFRLDHIVQISIAGDQSPATRGRRAA
ncbi:hypothetical protein [Streptacidiphilus albus]|jgi:hypothetical protein|uniref:hypothetical protein n=1 Tax=Streptacidiphilus albus TaxID=105425 RepID=UPI00054B56EC|nr:hypothetical protein [Streptacidiphilus albus]